MALDNREPEEPLPLRPETASTLDGAPPPARELATSAPPEPCPSPGTLPTPPASDVMSLLLDERVLVLRVPRRQHALAIALADDELDAVAARLGRDERVGAIVVFA